MKQAAGLKELRTGGLLPGIKVNTGPTISRRSAVATDAVQGRAWQWFGDIISADVGGTDLRRAIVRSHEDPRSMLRGFSFAQSDG